MTSDVTTPETMSRGFIATLNTSWHKRALAVFMVIVAAHLAEHVAQAIQIYVLGWHHHQARGLLGLSFPWLVHSEWLHYGYALAMLIGLIMLRPGFTGRARTWWNIAIGIQVWHFLEHSLLLAQAVSGTYYFGRSAPVSIIQLVVPRVELHLFYNSIVTAPMVVAMILHRWPRADERPAARCACAAASNDIAR
jgi:hypothetical protein